MSELSLTQIILLIFIDHDGDDSSILFPYSEEIFQDLLQNSIDVMQMASDPQFFIVDPQEYLSMRLNTSTRDSHILPPQFIISLSYKPLNNTVLSLFSVLSNQDHSPHQVRDSEFQNITTPASAVFNSSIILSDSAVLMMPDSYYVLWPTMSDTARSRYTINLIVINGELSTCLNGEYLAPIPHVELWNAPKRKDSLQMIFTPHLNAVSSLVKIHVKPL